MYAPNNPIPGVVYRPPERMRRYVEAGVLPQTTLVEALCASFTQHADRVALCTPEGDIRYAELDAITDRAAAALLRLGLKPLERVLFQSINSKELIYAIIGCFKAGLIPVCTLPAHREREIGYLGCHADARAHIVQGDDPKFDLQKFALTMKVQIPTLQHIISLRGEKRNGVLRLEDLIAAEDTGAAQKTVQAIECDPFQIAIFQLSGGTTGVPKIIPRMQNDYLLNATLTAEWLGFTKDDVMFIPMPIIHNACLICFLLPTLLSGAAFTLPANLTPESWGRVFREKRPTWVGLIRALLPRFNAMIEQGLATTDRIRAFWTPDAARLVRQKYAIQSYAMFGMTEGMNMYVKATDPLEVQDTMVGRPLSPLDEVRLVEPGTDREVAEGEIGEMTCRGPYTLAGYYNAPERNREAFTADGFYRSGDLMVRTEIDGVSYYAFAGRNKDTVNRGMEKINCEEVEGIVAAHPLVSDCAVVAMPDAVLGEKSCIFIVPKAGKTAPTVSELGEFMRVAGAAKFKWPERVETIDALPLTKVGKLDKATLRQMIAEKLAKETQVK